MKCFDFRYFVQSKNMYGKNYIAYLVNSHILYQIHESKILYQPNLEFFGEFGHLKNPNLYSKLNPDELNSK